jgi:hypothetical protein
MRSLKDQFKSPTAHYNLGLQRTVSFLIPQGGSADDQKYLLPLEANRDILIAQHFYLIPMAVFGLNYVSDVMITT